MKLTIFQYNKEDEVFFSNKTGKRSRISCKHKEYFKMAVLQTQFPVLKQKQFRTQPNESQRERMEIRRLEKLKSSSRLVAMLLRFVSLELGTDKLSCLREAWKNNINLKNPSLLCFDLSFQSSFTAGLQQISKYPSCSAKPPNTISSYRTPLKSVRGREGEKEKEVLT